MTGDALRLRQVRMCRIGIPLARKLVGVGSQQHVRLRTVMRTPEVERNGARLDFVFGSRSHPMATSAQVALALVEDDTVRDRKSTRLNSSHLGISYAVFCLKKKKKKK